VNNSNEGKKQDGFFQIPEYFHDYGLQVFTHTEYDVLHYILRNTIGWHKLECEISIKTIALMKHYSEKNIIKAINNLIAKTGVFNKVVYREKGSCIKRTKYIITENSVKLLNEYVNKNIPADFEKKKKQIKNRSMEAIERLEKGKQDLLEKQNELLQSVNDDFIETDNDYENEINYENKRRLLEAYKEIINDYSPDNTQYDLIDGTEYPLDIFKNYKKFIYDGYLEHNPQENNENMIDIKLSDLIPLTQDNRTINFYNTLIKNKKMIGGQKDYFYNTLKINFGIENERNFDRINILFE
jgi:hypothetical protein